MTRLLETLNPIEALVHETLNGEYELTFTTTARDVNKFDLLSAHTPNGRQLFRVAGVTNHADKSEIFARHVFFDLSGNFSIGFESKDVTCQTMINKFVSSLTEPLAPFALSTDITDRNSYNPEEANALEILSHGKRSIVGVNDAELLRDNYAVKLQKRLGSDTNVLIHPRNNILDLKREYSSDDICTKIFLRGGTEEAPLEATITSPLIDKYPVVYARRYQNETDSITTVEQLIAWGKLHFDTDQIDVPKLSFDFDVFGDLGLQLGDSALVRVPELDVDVRSRVTGYDYDPMTRKYVKLYFGDKSTGLAGFIGDTTTGIVDEAVKNVDEKLQAEIDNANEAIQKEYEARVEAVNDAIAKAETDAETMKKELQDEISQAVTDWNTEFEEAKTNIDNSIGNVSKELGEYIKSTDEIISDINDTISDLGGVIGDVSGKLDGYIEDADEILTGLGNDLETLLGDVSTQGDSITGIIETQEEFTRQIGVWDVDSNGTLSANMTSTTQTAEKVSTSLGSWDVAKDGTIAKNVTDVTKTAKEITESLGSWNVNEQGGTVSANVVNVKKTAKEITESLGSWNTTVDGTIATNLTEVKKTAEGVKTTVGSWDTDKNGTLAKKVSDVEQTANGVKTTVGSWDVNAEGKTIGSKLSEVVQTTSGLTSTVSSHTNQLDGKTTSALKTLADTANTNAGKAQTSADTANNLLTDIASDSKFTASEKQQAKKEWDIVVGEKAGITAEGSRYGISTTDYTNKYNTLNTYITPLLSSLTTTSDIVGTTYRANWKNYYDARQVLLNAISAKAKSLADTAQSTADTAYSEIQQTADKISMVVSDGSTASAVQLTPNALTAIAKDINLKGNVQFGSLVEGDGTSTEILGGKIKTNTIKTSTLVVDKEILVDGTIKAVHLDGGTANIAEITSLVMSTEALNAAWANIGNAFINKLTSDDALFQRLTAKTAWITSANIVSLDASKVSTGTIKSRNGLLEWNLDDSFLRFKGATNALVYEKTGATFKTGLHVGDTFSTKLNKWIPHVSLQSDGGSEGQSSYVKIFSEEQLIALQADKVFIHDIGRDAKYGLQFITGTDGVSIENGGTGLCSIGSETSPFNTVNANSLKIKSMSKLRGQFSSIGWFSDPHDEMFTQKIWRTEELGYSSANAKENIQALPDKDVRELFNNTKVKTYYYKKFDENHEQIHAHSIYDKQVGLVIEDVEPEAHSELLLNQEKTAVKYSNVPMLTWKMVQLLQNDVNELTEIVSELTEQGEMTLNTEIAILWKAVQELSEQNVTLRDELALERSERETLRAELNALTDLIAGKATVKVRT